MRSINRLRNYGTALVLGAASFGCAASPPTAATSTAEKLRVDPSGPTYSSVEKLAAASSVVARVTVIKKVEVRQDGDPAVVGDEIPTAIFDVKVDMVFKGAVEGEVIQVATLDEGASVVTTWETAPKAGEKLVMFLERLDPPMLQMTHPFYVFVGGNNGVMTVNKNDLVSRSMVLATAKNSDSDKRAAGAFLTLTESELAATVKG